MKSYKSLEQRMIQAYRDMFPPFIPLTDGTMPVEAQEQFYHFVQGVYGALFAAPELLFTSISEDDAFPGWTHSSYGKPKLYERMKKVVRVIEGLLAWLLELGTGGTLADSRLVIAGQALGKQQFVDCLPAFGLRVEGNALACDRGDQLLAAWRWMATREGASLASFSRCYFDARHGYLQEVYSDLFGDRAAFATLVQYLDASGYAHVEAARGPSTLDYVKKRVAKDVRIGTPMYGDPHHYGVTADYRYDAAVPQYLMLRVLDYRSILGESDSLPHELQAFLVAHTKACDRCGYCTQTDKTGKRKPLAIKVYCDGERVLCPLYPGFGFCFTTLDDELVANIISLLRYLDQRFAGQA